MEKYAPSDKVVTYLREVLYGPQGGENEEIVGTPFLRYMTGMLFPVGMETQSGEQEVSATAEDIPVNEIDQENTDLEATAAIEMAFEALPSAVGISFRVTDTDTVTCSVWGASYVKDDSGENTRGGRAGTRWQRKAYATQGSPEQVSIRKGTAQLLAFQGNARVVSRWRTQADGTAIVTITLVNTQVASRQGLDPAKTIFQVGIRCESSGLGFMPYHDASESHPPESEDAEVSFLYKDRMPFARGHGAAATWSDTANGMSKWVSTDFMPSVDVPYATFDIEGGSVDKRCLELKFLDEAPRKESIKALGSLARAYGNWIDSKLGEAKQSSTPTVALRLANRAASWLTRIREGLSLLERDDTAWEAFHLANRAMGWQMIISRSNIGGPYPSSARRRLPALDMAGLKWRPFQIAFILAVLKPLYLEDSNSGKGSHDPVDVIWFPTGGGKTEAYLLATSFELIRRRLVHGVKDTGTAIFSRYTLRLLTADQFQRTGALISSLELIRMRNPEKLGLRPFSLGLWVGNSLTPNKIRDAHEKHQNELQGNTPKNPFQLQACPCCGTEIYPSSPRRHRNGWDEKDFGVVSTQSKFYFRCTNVECEFTDLIPLNIVDEALYKDPPSIILGTMDKFAMLPWDERARVFFWGPNDDSVGPSLIIQDELHLISGPLGSLSAPYEAAIDAIIGTRGPIPKRIGSTATIRNAAEQVRGLYGREVSIFPPPCGSWDDAFFFNTDKTRPGRQYVGAMGQGYTKPVIAMAWTAAALLQAPKEVELPDDALNAYWTVLAYHNSRRELGRTITAARDEISARIKTIASSAAKTRIVGEPLELSAQMVKSMSEALGELKRPHTPEKPAIDLVPCTSIISVGVDVSRLGVMLVNGQPKLTSEYIQATSRVGRGNIPGLIVTLFSPSKPRDRSHYEDFRAYHQSIYRYVEPTSVTPYALPSRERTFHAALIALIRHSLKWQSFDSAGSVDFGSPTTQSAIESLLELMCASDPGEAVALRELAKQRINEWKEFAESNTPLYFENRNAGMQFAALLYQYGRASGNSLWPTMMSVRNVDSETPIAVQ